MGACFAEPVHNASAQSRLHVNLRMLLPQPIGFRGSCHIEGQQGQSEAVQALQRGLLGDPCHLLDMENCADKA